MHTHAKEHQCRSRIPKPLYDYDKKKPRNHARDKKNRNNSFERSEVKKKIKYYILESVPFHTSFILKCENALLPCR